MGRLAHLCHQHLLAMQWDPEICSWKPRWGSMRGGPQQASYYYVALAHGRLATMPIFRCRVELGYFGADSQKPIFVYSNMHWVGELPARYTRNWYPGSSGVTTVPSELYLLGR